MACRGSVRKVSPRYESVMGKWHTKHEDPKSRDWKVISLLSLKKGSPGVYWAMSKLKIKNEVLKSKFRKL